MLKVGVVLKNRTNGIKGEVIDIKDGVATVCCYESVLGLFVRSDKPLTIPNIRKCKVSVIEGALEYGDLVILKDNLI